MKAKAIALTVVAAVLAGLVALVVVGLSARWWGFDVTAVRIHFVVGAAVVGLAVGAAGAWFAPSVWWVAGVAAVILLGLYAPFLPGSAPLLDAVSQLVASVVGASAAVALVTGRRTERGMS